MTLSINIPKRGTALTNGDIIKALFPEVPIKIFGSMNTVYFGDAQFDLNWWDALYQEKKI
jgi:hypothetical protein